MLKILNTYYDNGWLVKQTHPTLPLTIWNYSRTTQFEGMWDEITIMCRGLVTDDETGEIVARPFKKFWNIEEAKHTPTKDFYVLEKMDGSLGIAFNYKGDWIFASRGSFISEQALKGIEIMNDTVNERMILPLNPKFTYMFEIIYPENRIVVDYGDDEKLVMLGAIHTKSGDELPHELLTYSHGFAYDIVKKYDNFTDISELKSSVKDDREGFVVVFSNGDKMKVKGEEYFRLHKIMTEVSTTAVWGVLSNGDSYEDLLIDVPDEFDKKIKEYIKELKFDFMIISETFVKLFDNYLENRNRVLPDKAEYSEWVRTFPKIEQAIFWRMYDNRDYSDIIWRLIKPKFRKL